MRRVAVIRKCKKGDSAEGKPWCLYTKDGSKLLGRHPTKESAEKQERAIQVSKHGNYLTAAIDEMGEWLRGN
jgi:hypothetical protein